MNLAGQSLKFENGQWVAGEWPFLRSVSQDERREPSFHSRVLPVDSVVSGGVDRRETQRLRKRNQQLEEENNLLRLKVDILLDMVRKAIRHDASVSPTLSQAIQMISPGPVRQVYFRCIQTQI